MCPKSAATPAYKFRTFSAMPEPLVHSFLYVLNQNDCQAVHIKSRVDLQIKGYSVGLFWCVFLSIGLRFTQNSSKGASVNDFPRGFYSLSDRVIIFAMYDPSPGCILKSKCIACGLQQIPGCLRNLMFLPLAPFRVISVKRSYQYTECGVFSSS